MNDGVCHASDQAQALAAHDLSDEVSVYLPEPGGHTAQEVEVQAAGGKSENGLERSFIHTAQEAGLGRNRLGRPRFAIEQCHLTEEAPWLHETECLLLIPPTGLGDFDPSLADQIHTITGIALPEDDIAGIKSHGFDTSPDFQEDIGNDPFE